jgi:predicted thioesterase
MRQIPLGAKGSFNLLVQPEHLANRFKDAILPPVLATPVMIMVIENAALNQGLSRSRRERGRYRR